MISHSYSIQDLITFDDKHKPGEQVRLLRLRNPWGKSEWTGAWGQGSPEEEAYIGQIKEYIETLPHEERFDIRDDDGTFLMHFDDWCDNFTDLFINVDFPEDWTGVRFKSSWTKSNSGGIPHKADEEEFKRFAKNPQYLLRPVKKTEILLSLCQSGGRLPHNGNYSQYPFID